MISWAGNAAEWNERLGIGEIRLGCSGEPGACMASLAAAARSQGVDTVTLAIGAEPHKLVRYAAEYSRLSLDSRLRGIGIDDFVSALIGWEKELGSRERVVDLLRTTVTNAKKSNPRLEFGITLYEDQLESSWFAEPGLPLDLRAAIDRVSLFVHFRENGVKYATYVRQARRTFPRAAIVAGVYAYDRTDYLPCRQGSWRKCSERQEAAFFEQTLSIQMALLQSKQIAGLEFYPGEFGKESSWAGWANPQICKPRGFQRCVETTNRLRRILMKALNATPSIRSHSSSGSTG